MALAKRSPFFGVLVLALILAATLLFFVGLVSAGDQRICSNETITSGTFSDVIVEAGTSCTLTGSTTQGKNLGLDKCLQIRSAHTYFSRATVSPKMTLNKLEQNKRNKVTKNAHPAFN